MSFAIQITPDTIRISHAEQYQVEIYPFGALLNRFAIRQANGQWHNAVAAYSSPQHAQETLTRLFRSAKLSPFVCRLDNAQYTHQGSLKTIRKFKLGDSAIHGLIFDAPFALQSSHSTATHASITRRYPARRTHPTEHHARSLLPVRAGLHPAATRQHRAGKPQQRAQRV